MKTILIVCRSEKEAPHDLVRLMKTLFPECKLKVVYDSEAAGSEASPASAPLRR